MGVLTTRRVRAWVCALWRGVWMAATPKGYEGSSEDTGCPNSDAQTQT